MGHGNDERVHVKNNGSVLSEDGNVLDKGSDLVGGDESSFYLHRQRRLQELAT